MAFNPGSLIDHGDAALDLHHGRAAVLCMRALVSIWIWASHLIIMPLMRDAHLVELDAALADLQLDRLHGLGFALAEIDLRRLIAHLDA